MELTKNNLVIAVDRAVEVNAKYFAVAVDVGLPTREVIVNSMENIMEGKLEYYTNAYNDNLELKVNPSIKITGFTFGDNFQDIQKDLV